MQPSPLTALHALRDTLVGLLRAEVLDEPTIAHALYALLRAEPVSPQLMEREEACDALYKLAWWLYIRACGLYPRQILLSPMSVDLMLGGNRSCDELLADLIALEEAHAAGELHAPAENPLIAALTEAGGVEHLGLSGRALRDHVHASLMLYQTHQASRDALVDASLNDLFTDYTNHIQNRQADTPSDDDTPLPSPAAYVSRGQQRFEDGEVDLALRDFNRAIQLDPNFAPALHNRAHVYAAAGDTDAALDDLAAVLTLHPDFTPALLSRSQLSMATGQFDRAEADLSTILDKKPDHVLARLLRASARTQLAQLDGAMQDIEAAIKLQPSTADLYVQRANIHRLCGRDDRAEADFSKAIQLNASLAAAWAGRAFLRIEHESWSAAESDLAHAIRHDPNNPVHYYNRGNTRIAQGNIEGAIEDYSEAILLDPEDIEARLNRGAAYLRLEDLEKTLADWDAAIQIDPYHPAPYARRGTLMWVSDELEQAEADLSRALELADDLWPLRHTIQQQLDDVRERLKARASDPKKMN
jgi:tetratricopeptide (TPR) repeat protein